MSRFNKMTNVGSDKATLWYKLINKGAKPKTKYFRLSYKPRGNARTPYVVSYGWAGVKEKIHIKRFKTKTEAISWINKEKKKY